jgi:CRP/FNR family transcriptional regulator, cyclic AMP receptor protein
MFSIYESIAKAPIFEGLEEGQLESIAAGAEELRVPAGTLVFSCGEAAGRFFLVGKGTVALEVESPGSGAVRVLTLHESDVVGWSWLFTPYRWEVDARAVTDCHLIAVNGVGLREECEVDRRLGYEIATRFGADALQRMKDSWYQILDLTVGDA